MATVKKKSFLEETTENMHKAMIEGAKEMAKKPKKHDISKGEYIEEVDPAKY